MRNQLLPLVAGIFVSTAVVQSAMAADKASPVLRKVEDIVIYQNEKFYSAFPSIVRRPDGELLVAFRRAPNRRLVGEKGYTHTDSNSQLVLVRSRDNGKTWSSEPELLYAHPFGGSQDPCMVQLRDGTILCTSYGWMWVGDKYAASLTNTVKHGNYAFMGGYVLRSKDSGHSWQGPFFSPPVQTNPDRDVFNQPVAAFNRGAMCEGSDGKIYWVVAASAPNKPRRTETHLMISSDKGETWKYSCPVAWDPKATFSETSLYETPKGDLLAFMRTADLDDHTVVARSTDNGKTFELWQDSGFQGHPHYALRLPDRRVLLIYGYRHKPFGVRARVLDAECTNLASSEEMVLRDDGGTVDLGYPWATMVSKSRVLVVYYFNKGDGLRHIAGTVLEIKK
jgi:hypothetical protein